MKTFLLMGMMVSAAAFGVRPSFGQMTFVNGASFASGQSLAPGSFGSIFGQNLCSQTVAGDWIAPGQLPTSLGNCTVSLNGAPAMLQYVSPGQINFIVPPGMGPGTANVIVSDGATPQMGSLTIGSAGPGVFAMNGMGMGDGAMLHGLTFQDGPFSTTTDGETTPVAMYVTGLDLSTTPVVSIGGMPAEVTWYGDVPGYAGLQQININVPAAAAGAGRIPVTVTSDGQTSNVTFMGILPTTSMMQGMPGWGGGMTVAENMPRGHELSYAAYDQAGNSVLVTDQNDDAVRMISLDSNQTIATITLPSGSQAEAVAVDASGAWAAVALTARSSVALIDLAQRQVVAVIGTGYYPSHLAFAGTRLLVTNGGGGSVSVIDTASRSLIQNIPVGFGPSGIAASGDVAVVANMQGGTLSMIDLQSGTVSNIDLPPGSRPYEVAISAGANKALITDPMSNGFLILDLALKNVTSVSNDTLSAMGPGAIAIDGGRAFIANQMTASVTELDLMEGKIMNTFDVDPGPIALCINPTGNQLMVLAEGTGTLDVVDVPTYGIMMRLNAADTERQGTWELPWISSITPNTAAAGSSFTLTINGSNLQDVTSVAFEITGFAGGSGSGMGGMMGGGSGQGMGSEDANVKVSNMQISGDGTRITAQVEILSSATAGYRMVSLETNHGEVMGMMSGSLFSVTK